MYFNNLKSFIASDQYFTCNLSYQRNLQTCQKEFLLMGTSTQNYVLSQQTVKKSTISTTLTN